MMIDLHLACMFMMVYALVILRVMLEGDAVGAALLLTSGVAFSVILLQETGVFQ